jgi:hypothetical protein
MKNTQLIELTNKYIDNELTKNEKSKLDDLLKDETNKSYFDSMIKTVNTLEVHKPANISPNIKDSVINKILNQREEKIMDNLKYWWQQLFNGTKISYAVSFALGAVLVTFVFLFQSPNDEWDDSFMKGTMSSSNFDETYYLNEHDFDGAVNVKYADNITILDVNLNTQSEVDCELSYDKTQFVLYGVKSLESKSSGKFASSGGNSIRLSNLESNHYMVFLRNLKNSSSKVHASFYKGNTRISNLTININY